MSGASQLQWPSHWSIPSSQSTCAALNQTVICNFALYGNASSLTDAQKLQPNDEVTGKTVLLHFFPRISSTNWNPDRKSLPSKCHNFTYPLLRPAPRQNKSTLVQQEMESKSPTRTYILPETRPHHRISLAHLFRSTAGRFHRSSPRHQPPSMHYHGISL